MVIDIYGANGNRYIDLSTLFPLLTYPQYQPIHNIDLSTILSFSMELLTLGLVFALVLGWVTAQVTNSSHMSPHGYQSST